MTNASVSIRSAAHAPSSQKFIIGPVTSRALLIVVIGAAFATVLDLPDSRVAAGVDPEFVRLLRFMALVKAAMASAVLAALFWRLAMPISPKRFAVYAILSGAMVAGPPLIWGMAHVGLGAVLLQSGLVAMAVLLWRDPAAAVRLTDLLRARAQSRRTHALQSCSFRPALEEDR